MSAERAPPLLALENITKTFPNAGREILHAVNGVSLTVHEYETVALVGESGSGKTTLGRIALGLIRPDSGRVLLDGRDLEALSAREFRAARTAMQPIFQDPTASLNPRRTVRSLLAQACRMWKGDVERHCILLLESVGLHPGVDYMGRLPHELSGGQRQRLVLARAIAMQPRLIIADEALSGADVSIRGQLLNLLLDIREERRVAYLMITHDISVARAFADRVAVLMRGQIVECGATENVLVAPQHEYTQRLLQAVPTLDRTMPPGRHATRPVDARGMTAASADRAGETPE
jgi:ABC-type glutathione transport system ATPase component